MFKFVNNDTIALICLGIVTIVGVITLQEQIAIAGLGALGGYIGGRTIKESNNDNNDKKQ